MSDHPYPDHAYLEKDQETNEKRWFSTKGMGVGYVHEDRVAEDVAAAVLAERETIAKLREALRTAAFDLATEDIFGDNPRVTAAINRANDVLRATEPKPERVACSRCDGSGRVNEYQCEGPCECGLCPDVYDCPECTRETV